MTTCKPYSSGVSNEEWAFVAPCLALITEAAPQRRPELREVFNGRRSIMKTGMQRRRMPNDAEHPCVG